MPFRRIITIAALVLLGILLAAFLLVGFCDVYQNHIVRDCGANCDRPPSDGAVQRGS